MTRRLHFIALITGLALALSSGCDFSDSNENNQADAGGLDAGPCTPALEARCLPEDNTTVFFVDSCTGESQPGLLCSNGKVCVDKDPLTGETIDAECGVDPDNCDREPERDCASDASGVVDRNACSGSETMVLECGAGEMCSTKDPDSPARTVEPACVPAGCTTPHHQTELRCDTGRDNVIVEFDLCNGDTSIEKTCLGGQVCITVDPITGATIEPRCGEEVVECVPEFERECASDNSGIVDTNSCTGEEIMLLECGAGQMCSTKDPDRPALTVAPACVPDTCTTPRHQTALECDPLRDNVILERDLCTGDGSIEQVCVGSQACLTIDPLTGATTPPQCGEPPEVCRERFERVCDPNNPSKIIDVEVCSKNTTEIFDCGDQICSTFDPNLPSRRITPQCVAPECTIPHATEQRCDDFNPRNGVTVDLCNGKKTTYLRCSLDELCTTEDPNDPSLTVAPRCAPKPPTCNGNLITRECDPVDPAIILEVNSCTGDVNQVQDCGTDICSARDTLNTSRQVSARCVAPECGSPHATEQVCDDFNPRRAITVDLCNGRETTDFTCRLDEICSTEDPNDPSLTVAPRCIPKPVVCVSNPERSCDPGDPSRIIETDNCTGAVTLAEDCGTDVCTTEDPNVVNRRIAPRCVAPECGLPHATEQVCDDFNPRRGVTVDLCNGRKTTDFTCPIGQTCATEDPANPGVAVAPFCLVVPPVCGPNDITFECDPSNPLDILEIDTCQNTSTLAQTCEVDEVCSTSDPNQPGRLIDAQCVPAECADPHVTERRCDLLNPRRGVTVDLCNGQETTDFTCDFGEVCSTEDPSDPGLSVAPYCLPDDTPCTPGTEFVCDPSDPSRVLERDRCSGSITAITSCQGAQVCSTLSQSSPPQVVPAQCVPASCIAPRPVDTYCDPSDTGRVVTIEQCTGDVVATTDCQAGEICSVVDPGDPTASMLAQCVPAQCNNPTNDVTCDPRNPRQILSTNSCTGVTTVIDTCAGALEQCSITDGAGSSIPPSCVMQCGDAQTSTTCDSSDPGKVFWADACGNVTGERFACEGGSTCESDGAGGATCSCVPTGPARCLYGLGTPSLQQDTSIVRDTTCGGQVTVEQCDFGSRCFQEAGYNNGEPECARSIDSSQATSPYYDYGCGNFSDHVRHKTSLEVDCRCRIYGFGGMGSDYADPVTGASPGRPLQHCDSVFEVHDLTWPIPAGSGPKMIAFTTANSADDRWYGGHLDETTRTLYALVRWTNSLRRATATVVSFDLDTGERKIISGVYPDMRNGDIDYGSGYLSPNSVAQGPATQPFTGAGVMRADAAGNLYVLGVGTTGSGNSRSAEIVRVDPSTGARTLVWQSATNERGASTAAFGQCLPDATATESVPITPHTLAIGPQGQFFMGFYQAREGSGLIEVSADGSTCRFVTWFNNQLDASKNTGSGYTPQSGNKLEGLMYRNGKLYGATSLTSALVRVDVATGQRTAVSLKSDGYNGLGFANILWDDTRSLIWAVGKVPNLIGAVVDESTGRREEIFADTTVPGTPLLDSAYDVRRSVFSPTTTIANVNYLGMGPFFLDPDNPDIAWMVLKGGALLKFEFSTFNNYIFSL